MSKSLVPHRETMNQHYNLKGVSSQSRWIYVLMLNAEGGNNTPHVGEGYYRVPLCGGLAHKIFDLPAKAEKNLISTKIER
jgi:hypothetical protein